MSLSLDGALSHGRCDVGFDADAFRRPRDSQDGDDLDEVQGRVVQLSDEDRGHALEERRSVHVDRRSDGQDEAADVLGHAVIFLHALHHQGQSGGARKQGSTSERMKDRGTQQ